MVEDPPFILDVDDVYAKWSTLEIPHLLKTMADLCAVHEHLRYLEPDRLAAAVMMLEEMRERVPDDMSHRWFTTMEAISDLLALHAAISVLQEITPAGDA